MGELGSLLTRAREARGLTLEDAERDTRISRRYLQALETEQFEVIPAPVYARGFLRSYSQYLGLDPAEALDMFPREDDPQYQRAADRHAPSQRASRETPVSPVSAARPTWRTSQPAPSEQPVQPSNRTPLPERPPSRRQPDTKPGRPVTGKKPSPADDPTWEPVIGVDIGLASPARKINTDPAAQTRSVVVAIIALGVILGAVLIAIIISNLGGAAETPPGTGPDATEAANADAQTTETPAAASGVAGIVPTVLGLPEAQARQMLTSAGYTVRELRVSNSATKGEVIEQTPEPGIEWPAGRRVDIVISEGPS